LPDGTLDPAFGVLITDFSTAAVRSKANPLDNDDVAFRVAVLSNNDILVVGLSNDEVAVALYSAEGATIGKTVLGAPMDQFGDWAIPTTVIPTTGTNANTIDFFVGGSVYSALTGDNLEAYEVSINANSGASALVNTFGNGGGFNYNFTSYSNDFVNGVAVDASGNVILTGESDSSTYNPISGHTNFFLMRLTPAGVLDKTFNSDGVADVLDFGSTYSGGTSVTVQTNGDILATAWGNGQGEVIRFLPSGLLDPAFGARGIVPLGDFFATRVIAQPDGQILIIGGDGTPINFGPNGWPDETNFGPTTADTVLLVDQLNTDGSFDSTFGNTGVSGEASTESVLSSTDPEFGQLDLAGMNGIYDALTGKVIVIGTDVGPAGPVGDVGFGEITSQTNSEFILADFIDDVAPPTSVLAANDINTPGQATIDFTVTYADTVLVEASTIGSSNVLVTGPNGYSQFGQLVSTSSLGANAQSITATYQIIPGGGAVTIADNGLYTVTLEPNQIADTSGNVAPLRKLGNFAISIGATQPTLPTATLTDATSETSPGTTTYDFIVT
jgi:uncharacterized delta-60 repeat protein